MNEDIQIDDIKRAATAARELTEFTGGKVQPLYDLWARRAENGVERTGAMFKRSNKLFVCVPKFVHWWMHGEDRR